MLRELWNWKRSLSSSLVKNWPTGAVANTTPGGQKATPVAPFRQRYVRISATNSAGTDLKQGAYLGYIQDSSGIGSGTHSAHMGTNLACSMTQLGFTDTEYVFILNSHESAASSSATSTAHLLAVNDRVPVELITPHMITEGTNTCRVILVHSVPLIC